MRLANVSSLMRHQRDFQHRMKNTHLQPATDVFAFRSRIDAPARDVFDWHTRPGVFERLVPPWEDVRVVLPAPSIAEGTQAIISVPFGPFRREWMAEHRDVIPGEQFRDIQVRGPFARWEHTHRVEPDGPSACHLEDRIEYALPGGRLGRLFGGGFAREQLQRMFRYRHAVTSADVPAHARTPREACHMNVLISGSTGLVGSALIPFLTSGGHEVIRLLRVKGSSTLQSSSKEAVYWDPDGGRINPGDLEGLDAVVHLAGDPIASGHWTAAKKARIRDSRVVGTRLLCEALAKCDRPPQVLVSASAIGFYGDRGDEVLTESSPAGIGFLADVCREWEDATQLAASKGIRTVTLRTGVVLSPAGGALAKMLPPFKMGVGGVLGSGRQYMSWISIDDLIGAIHHSLINSSVSGPVNGTAPSPVTNREFTKTLGRVLHRLTIFPMPAFAARLAFGEMADELLLSGQRVQPLRLLNGGYSFRHSDLETALRHVLGR
jgi:uncharacterized protein (TIGR01777 family)